MIEPAQTALILTPNQRLARVVRSQLQSQKTGTWITEPVMAFNTWLRSLWEKHIQDSFDEKRICLSSPQEEFLWKKVINKPELDAPSIRLSLQARNTLKQWNLDLNSPGLNATPVSREWLKWAQAFDNECQLNHFIGESDLANWLMSDKSFLNYIEIPEIILYDFIEFSPQQEKLLNYLRSHNITITEQHPKSIYQSAHQIAFESDDEEILTIARWAKHLVDRGEASIACVFPELNQNRNKILSIFESVFHNWPQWHNTLIDSPYNISAGAPLNSFPLIQETFCLLQLCNKSLTLSQINKLLKNPLLKGADEELSLRHKFFEHYCDLKVLKQDRDIFINDLQDLAPLLYSVLSTFQKELRLVENKTLPACEWAPILSNLLNILGWPGDHSLSSAEFQLVNRFLSLLGELADLDLLSSRFSLPQILFELEERCRNTIFQFQTKQHAIEILGVLEASGLQFQHTWVASMTHSIWPPVAKPNPFLPKSFQRSHNMPHSSPDRELSFCEKMTEEFKKHSKNLIFSFSNLSEEQHSRASSLISDLPFLEKEFLELSPYAPLSQTIYQSALLESIDDTRGLSPPAEAIIPGGTGLFKDQASCPFKAYLYHRLAVKPIETPLWGLNAAERGSLLHEILERIWSELKCHENLVSLTEIALEELLLKHIQATLNYRQKQTALSERFKELEEKRLCTLLKKWFDLEKAREPFSVTSREVLIEMPIKNIRIKMTIDRMDTLADGRTLLIDYKTGQPAIAHWFGERPDEPQLPLYSLGLEKAPDALAFAFLHPINLAYKGLSANTISFSEIKTAEQLKINWDEQISSWKITLENIALEIESAYAAVAPKSANTSCQYCDLHSVCRIHECKEHHDF